MVQFIDLGLLEQSPTDERMKELSRLMVPAHDLIAAFNLSPLELGLFLGALVEMIVITNVEPSKAEYVINKIGRNLVLRSALE